MTLPNSSVAITTGAGTAIATHTVGGKEVQAVAIADESGHLAGSLPTYGLITPPIAVGASKLYLDLFNATGSGRVIDVRGIWLIPKLDVAVVGAVAVRVDAYRTSAVGTGGSTVAANSATVDVATGTTWKFDENNADIPAQITARVAPAGGATISRWLFPNNVAPEESNTSMGYLTQWQNLVPSFMFGQKFTFREGQGLLLKQGSVASVGSVSIFVAFTLE